VVVEVEEESSVEVFEASASVEKVGDQAGQTVDETVHDIVEEGTSAEPVLMEVDEVRTGIEPVLESVEKELRDQAVKAGGEPAYDAEEERTGAEPVLENVEDRSGAESDLMEVEQVVRTGDEPVHEAEELRTGKKHVPADVEMGTGDMPVRELEMGDSHNEDFQGDDFEKVGEFMPEETPRTPADPTPEISSKQTPSIAEPRRKRIKTLAGRTDLPWVRKLIALKSKTSSSSQQTSQKQPSQPTRKSYRLAAQGSSVLIRGITRQNPRTSCSATRVPCSGERTGFN